MSLLPVYLNDASLPSQGLEKHELISCIEQMISALREISKLADELVIGSKQSIASVGLCERYQTFASLTKEIDRDWWRFFKRLENRSPFCQVPHSIQPDYNEEVKIDGLLSEGALWAHRNSSLLLSLPWSDRFASSELAGVLHRINGNEVAGSAVKLRQVSTIDTVNSWKEFIESYGIDEAASSLIFEDQDVSIRMYLNDHEPPHVHVFLSNEPRRCRAKIRVDNNEYLKSTLQNRISNHVIEIVRTHKTELETSWQRCKDGRHPLRLQGAIKRDGGN